ncbi:MULTISPECIES: DNA mismatch repair endonuclease MutL [unclassified Shinella]|jgi:DNA mismatch repair protein MutL|uniref:DNA mismatch repair endonuclease MutL n=1 Tax=unclassified Shinella TaxID=2643062 RepID=UPI00102D6060|nr:MULTISPECIES: DNA mismatch repair endonuclease MutL [unclassified Shinella]MCO5150124.1 DNA mismatch repair endonuclease MutL [Shinella sp.]MDC7261071.1 DNA mismatch repair endonuclease MutL [Shinella sp. HY16]MDC7267966.1 DNA mismatch repair endonuclease MutL [Shinella sp. YZ44]TAA56055.1 DNA mismatch repair endonuclease MutL [Shinella sp. JR1-6]
MTIRQLSETLINQIAAGEVIERPASAAKELIENALDAGATRIEIATAGGGKTLLRVTDNGGGMAPADLELAIRRHCTSKLDKDLTDIRTLGFRGEALPSIGSVAKLSLLSRTAEAGEGAEISVTGGKVAPVRPAAANRGTVVEVRDLFFATPARLKFLKSEKAEASAISDVVRRMAIAFPHVRFVLSGSDRTTLEFPATGTDRLARIAQVLGRDFRDNAIEIDAAREGVRLTGFAGVPTFNRGNSLNQFAFVNGRPVQDKLIWSALRAAYAETIPHGRYPVAVLAIDIDPALVDVNVHPAKSDVRFRDPGLVRGLIIGAIREALAREGDRASTTGASGLMRAFRPEAQRPQTPWSPAASPYRPFEATSAPAPHFSERQTGFADFAAPSARSEPVFAPSPATPREEEPPQRHPLGAARAQLHENYIVAQTEDGLVIVDQHAAHERLVFEAMRNALHARAVPAQALLIPEIVDLSEDDCDRLVSHAEEFSRLGLGIERFGPGAVAIRETPAMLGEMDAVGLVRQLADELAEWDTASGLKNKLEYLAATMACHGSVRSGRRMRPEEMNALLRQMEATPGSGQCNHGRPTYIELKLSDIERLFGRS